jgi:hypothetical protein
MPFAVTTPKGHVVRLDDVPLDTLGQIAEDAGLGSWAEMLVAPIKNHKAAAALFKLACETTGDDCPDPLTPKALIPAFNWVDDDLPTSFQGGSPLQEGDPKTSGSSSELSDSDGPPPYPGP